ncbi:D-glycero-beta-D-manno-heptose 1-phosphate adenylyltransferase [soil metagenome]
MERRNKIITYKHVPSLCTTLSALRKSIVIAGGCFDILHTGHIAFLEASKAQGDTLVIFLEADMRISKLKGENRPVHMQATRAQILATLPTVDYIILLPDVMTNDLYDQLILSLKPAIITATNGDPYRTHKERQAKLVGGKVKTVIDLLPEFSTTKLVSTLPI